MFDLCVVGGGMSGMAAAITAARCGSKVIIIEKNNKLGKKIYATGNGKCNIGNINIDYKAHYNSFSESYGYFLEKSCGMNPTEELIEFFNSLGIVTTDNRGYIYPNSMQASSVVWAMIDELKRLNVEVILGSTVTDIKNKTDYYIVVSSKDMISAKQIILACGGNSYSKLGGSMSGYELSKKIGHNITKLRPSLCGLITYEDTADITGVRIRSEAFLVWDDKIIFKEEGELQFTDYGLSGIMIFNISSRAGYALQKNKPVKVIVDFIPHIHKKDFDSIIYANKYRTVSGMLNSVINDKLAVYILDKEKVNPKTMISSMTKDTVITLLGKLKEYTFNIKDTKDYDSAQLTAGGVDINDITPETLMSKLQDRIYFIGEMLDIDGLCGGYNITFAVLSGIRAGNSSYDKNK